MKGTQTSFAHISTFIVGYTQMRPTANSLLLTAIPPGIGEKIAAEVVHIGGTLLMMVATHFVAKWIAKIKKEDKDLIDNTKTKPE